jgi:uncharacterized protein YlxW (UPF0749 family)
MSEPATTTNPEGPPASDPTPARGWWPRLRATLTARPTRSQLLIGLLLALLGFAVVAQVRAEDTDNLTGLREQDLVSLLDEVSERGQRLAGEVAELEATRQELAAGTDAAALEEARARADAMAVLAGTVPVSGPGAEMTILDPAGAVTAGRLLDAVEELRGAGAEALQVGRVRVVAGTAFVDTPNGIDVDGELVAPPYHVIAIGDPQALTSSLQIPGGVLETLRQEGADPILAPRDQVTIDAIRPLEVPEHARPDLPDDPAGQ